MKLSNTNREETMRQILDSTYDVIVVGGGLTGASILFDLQMRGLRTLLLEKNDYASGASESFDLLVYDKVTFQTLPKQKKQELHQLNKNIGEAFQFLPAIELVPGMPVTSELKARVWPLMKRRPLDKPMSPIQLTRSQKQQFESVGTSIQTTVPIVDTVRLTLDLLKASVALGADAINYQMVTDLYHMADKLRGVFVEDQMTGETHVIYAKKVINATGLQSEKLHNELTIGASLKLTPRRKYQWFVPSKMLPIDFPVILKQGILPFTVSIIPKDDGVLISTVRPSAAMERTKTVFQEVKQEIERVIPEAALDINHVFTLRTTKEVDTNSEKTPFNIYKTTQNVLTTIGSPVLNYRQYAEKVGDEIIKQFKEESAILYERSSTKTRPVTIEISDEFSQDVNEQENKRQLLNKYQLDDEQFLKLCSKVDRLMIDYSIPKHLFIELLYTVEYEGVYKALDFLERRLRLGVFSYPFHSTIVYQMLRFLEYYLAWTKEERSYYEREVKQYLEECKKFMGFEKVQE